MNEENHILKGILLALLAALLLSTKAIFAKLAYAEGAFALGLMFWRMLFSLPIFVIVLRKTISKDITQRQYLQVILLGALGYYCSSFFDFKGLEYLDASIERLVLFTYPSLVVIIRSIYLKKSISKPVLISLIFTYIGLILVFTSGLDITSVFDHSDLLVGVGWVELAAFTYAIYLIGSESLIPVFGAKQFTSIASIASTVFVMIHTILALGEIPIFNSTALFWIFCISILATVLPIYLISYSISLIGASRMAIVGSIGPLFTIILAFLILKERMTFIQLFGGILIIISIGMITQTRTNKK